MKLVAERSTAYLTLSFLDKAGALEAPSSVQYRIDCKTSGQAVRDWTGCPPGPSVEIVLTPEDNAMQNAANDSERRLVTVIANYGASDEVRDACEYYVRNLEHAS